MKSVTIILFYFIATLAVGCSADGTSRSQKVKYNDTYDITIDHSGAHILNIYDPIPDTDIGLYPIKILKSVNLMEVKYFEINSSDGIGKIVFSYDVHNNIITIQHEIQ